MTKELILKLVRAAMLRPGMYAGEQADRSDIDWKLDAFEAVLDNYQIIKDVELVNRTCFPPDR